MLTSIHTCHRVKTRTPQTRADKVVAELCLDGSEINKDNFDLPTLGPKLKSLQKDVYHGRGFTVLRGLDPNEYSSEDLTMIFIGISTYIGGRVGRQDKAGNCLVHIIADKTSQAHHRHSTDQIVSYGLSVLCCMMEKSLLILFRRFIRKKLAKSSPG